MTKTEQLETRIKELEESMSKMQTCALIIKKLTQKLSGVDIDKEIEKELKGNDEKPNEPVETVEKAEVKLKKEPVDKQTIYKNSNGYYTVHSEILLKNGFVVTKDTKEYTTYEKYE